MTSDMKTVGDRQTKSTDQHTLIPSRLVLFDFDGTITEKDTLLEFVRFYCGRTRYYVGLAMLAPVMFLFAARLIENWKAKQYFLARFFKGENLSHFNSRCIEFTRTILPSLVRPAALDAILKYQKENATVAVVSASAENWVKPWCDQLGLICLATRLEVRGAYLTGMLDGPNCHGGEKVCRIRERFDLTAFDDVIAYGDSRGDEAMLKLAHQRFYKPFR
jgi:HAD superfamily hydrolase (TIGR01490 family)